jgi:hypothetical protein
MEKLKDFIKYVKAYFKNNTTTEEKYRIVVETEYDEVVFEVQKHYYIEKKVGFLWAIVKTGFHTEEAARYWFEKYKVFMVETEDKIIKLT